MYVTLEEAKAWCREYNPDDDALLARLITAAEEHVAMFLNRPLTDSELHQTGGTSPPDLDLQLKESVKVGILYYVADFYENREITVAGSTLAVNKMAESILYPYRTGLGV